MIVLDASALVDVVLDTEPFADRVQHHLRDHEGEMHAPHRLDAEVGRVLRRYVLARQMSTERAERAVERLRQLRVIRYPHLPFLSRAMQFHRNLTVYDGLYVALAEPLVAPLATRDRRLARSAGRPVEVILIR
ncbi:MAG TPA: type II toxin-antitoxin system VapC family toxin [Actinomycetota bacterium]|nr:type II toxin-antitoxin system VapC family toxin [Actinomycetota bacterium]